MLTVRNKRVLLELLKSEAVFSNILIVRGLEKDELTKTILVTAEEKGVPIEERPIHKMSKRRSGETHEVLTGHLLLPSHVSLDEHLITLYKTNTDPFFLILNRLHFPANLGVVIRTAYAAGVNGLLFQGSKDDFFTEDTLHYSMGAIARIPLVKANIFDGLKILAQHGIPTFCLHMDGTPYYTANLTGPVSFVLGAERHGASETVLNHCSNQISLPMQDGIDSLNVSASASIVLYEKVRQEKMK